MKFQKGKKMAEKVYKLSDLASGKLDLKSLLENIEMNAVEGVIEGVDKKTPKQVSNEVNEEIIYIKWW